MRRDEMIGLLIKYNFFLLFLVTIVLFSCSEKSEVNKLIKSWENQAGSKEKGTGINIVYPRDNTLFPPEISSPVFEWEDISDANNWAVFIKDGNTIIYESLFLKKQEWQPDSANWELIKQNSIEKNINVTILGIKRKRSKNGNENEIVSSSSVTIRTSKDSVKAPIFYRTVTLPFGFAVDHLNTISWRLGNIASRHSPPVVLSELPVCGNCHSFSMDGKFLGMDIDYGNDKGSYFIGETEKKIMIEYDDIITWSDYKREDGENTFGLLSQISPDGKWALSTVKDRSIFVRIDDIYYSQLFFPIKGIIGIYDAEAHEFSTLPGADNPEYCQSNPCWSPDAKEIIFTRAPYYKVTEAEKSKEVVIPTEYAREFIEGETEYKYDLYRIPFNNGNGGKAEPVEGASNNGKSNYFAKYSPDGKWLVFTQADNFMLLQPDATLYIMPASGGTPRRMNCNNPNTMNSWHSWSPNSRWLVFSSKARGAYTQLYLTHIDENGNDSPPVYLRNLSVNKFACNIPEFVNIKPGEIDKIVENFMDNDNYSFVRGRSKLSMGDFTGALEDVNKALEMEPGNPIYYNLRALIKVEQGNYHGALEDFSKVVELTPKRFDAYANRATAKFNLRDFKGAIKDLNKTIELNPKGSRGYFSRGTSKYNIGDYYGAIKDFTQSIKLNYKNADVWFERGIARLQVGQFEKGCDDLRKAKELGNEKAIKYINDFCE
jgi:tetratricopeptide (TPR) repeat protein